MSLKVPKWTQSRFCMTNLTECSNSQPLDKLAWNVLFGLSEYSEVTLVWPWVRWTWTNFVCRSLQMPLQTVCKKPRLPRLRSTLRVRSTDQWPHEAQFSTSSLLRWPRLTPCTSSRWNTSAMLVFQVTYTTAYYKITPWIFAQPGTAWN